MVFRFIARKYLRIFTALSIATIICVLMIAINAISVKSTYYFYLPYNLLLAFISPILAIILKSRLESQEWLRVPNLIITVLLLLFLPNSFYMITDLIHVQAVIGIDVLYNIIFTNLAIFIGLTAGFVGLFIFHNELIKRMYYKYAHILVGLLIILISFGVYLGRYLRWNSWDILINPGGILFDASDTLIHPSLHPVFFPVISALSLTIGSMYIVIWQFIKYFKQKN